MPNMTPFITPVNAAGLPIAMTFRALATGAENIKPIPPAVMCRLYWKLQSITFQFKVRLETETLEHHLIASTPLEPIQRIAKYPVLETNGVDKLGMTYGLKLPLNNVSHCGNQSYGLSLFFEYTNNKSLHFSFHPLNEDVRQKKKLTLRQELKIPIMDYFVTGFFYLYEGKKRIEGSVLEASLEANILVNNNG